VSDLLIVRAYQALLTGQIDEAKALLREPAKEALLEAFESGQLPLPGEQPVAEPVRHQISASRQEGCAKGDSPVGERPARSPVSGPLRSVNLAVFHNRLNELAPGLRSTHQKAQWFGFQSGAFLPKPLRKGQTEGVMLTKWAGYFAGILGQEILVSEATT
jgi:hypothetical protein